jgi:SMC interacting uncharacterized protein involved in chromosome segregation
MPDNPETLRLLEQMDRNIQNLREDFRDVRKEFREDFAGLESEVKNLNGFRHRILGVASAVSAAAALVMSVLVAYVTKKF